MKQYGSNPVEVSPETGDDYPLKLRDRKGGDMGEWAVDMRVREFPR